jgi:hypothetical protein
MILRKNVKFPYDWETLIYFTKFLCWENGVLQLVSEQVGSSSQVDESLCRVTVEYCLCVFYLIVMFYYVIMFNWLILMWFLCIVWSFYFVIYSLRYLGNNLIRFLLCCEFRGQNSSKLWRVVLPSLLFNYFSWNRVEVYDLFNYDCILLGGFIIY